MSVDVAGEQQESVTAAAQENPFPDLALVRDVLSLCPWVKPAHRGVLYELAKMTVNGSVAHQGATFPARVLRASVRQIADKVGLSRSTAAASVEWLTANGWLFRYFDGVAPGADSSGHSAQYALTLPALELDPDKTLWSGMKLERALRPVSGVQATRTQVRDRVRIEALMAKRASGTPDGASESPDGPSGTPDASVRNPGHPASESPDGASGTPDGASGSPDNYSISPSPGGSSSSLSDSTGSPSLRSGASPGLLRTPPRSPDYVADDLLGDPTRVDEGQQPQEGARDAQVSAPDDAEMWTAGYWENEPNPFDEDEAPAAEGWTPKNRARISSVQLPRQSRQERSA
ncbi:winged helix-turn-helix domain-containing protein (plasmid) [Streptomyces sp. BI20]|uniref:winged helix-turn-helix domain-containing protein n=1 Tax=Streptomyces sp. BI20 TaxID=3403460 RepID=UPI003C727F29